MSADPTSPDAGPAAPARAVVLAGAVVGGGADGFGRGVRGDAGMITDAATDSVVTVARYASGAVERSSASPRSANTLHALPTAPDDRFSVRAMSRGVKCLLASSARTLATIARSSPLRNRDADAPAGVLGTVPAGAGTDGVGVVIGNRPVDRGRRRQSPRSPGTAPVSAVRATPRRTRAR
ncbi:hypothetical protein ACWEFJ_30700 [Actinosynnema sp. NPDC004786]